MHKDTHPVFVGAADGATALGVSKNGFENFVDKGVLPPPKRLGRRKLWELNELIEAVRALTGSNTKTVASTPNQEQAQRTTKRVGE